MSEGARRAPWGLLLWVAAACGLFWYARHPPSQPAATSEEVAAMQRGVDLVVRDVKEWQQEQGDLTLPWDEADGHLAIVIDDVGRELHVLEKMNSLRFRLTYAILPGAAYAAGAQIRLSEDRRRYREIILHLPMEPLDTGSMAEGPEADETFLLQSDDRQKLHFKLEEALGRVPAAVGVNNHMGSLLTADRAVMDAIMPIFRQRNLFFLDSRTTGETAAEAAAEAEGLPVLARHVFLDNDLAKPAIEAELRRAAQMSTETPVVAIGHPSVELYAVLRERLPELHDRKIAVFPLSWLLDHPGER